MHINNVTPSSPKVLSNAVVGDCFMIPSKLGNKLVILVDLPDEANPGCYKVVELGENGTSVYRTAQGLLDPSTPITLVAIESVDFHEK